jgi:ATP-dependent Clp protease ATP-binding subunit ClpB
VDAVSEYLKKKLTDVFKPELLNRFSRVVVFKDLDMEHVARVAAIQLADFAAALSDQGMKLTFGADVVTQIAKLGYDPAFGARPLRRAIDEHLRAPLARFILEKGLGHGAEVSVAAQGGSFTFSIGVGVGSAAGGGASGGGQA